jgi:hypothetical protein
VKSNQKIVLKEHPIGAIHCGHFAQIEAAYPRLEPNHFILRNHYLSMDSGFRQWMNEDAGDGYLPGMQLGDPVQSIVIGEVIESDNSAYPASSIVLARTSWEQYSVLDGSDLCSILAVDPSLELYHYAAALGTTGLTAYFGLNDIGQPKAGDTLLVSTAAGAVGSVVCELGKAAGCRVIGMTSSEEKCRWLDTALKVDGRINYNASRPLTEQIAEACPDGVDIFFDNVGGSQLDAALANINSKARIVLCGAMSQYQSDGVEPVYNTWPLITQRARAEGFMFSDYQHQYAAALTEMGAMIKAGTLQSHVSLYQGIASTPQAFTDMMSGKNLGKCMVEL